MLNRSLGSSRAIEISRAERRLGAALQAAPEVFATADHVRALSGLDLAEIAITSSATLHAHAAPDGVFTLPDVPGVGVIVHLASGDKCERCWRVLPEVGRHQRHATLCERCIDAVDHLRSAAE